MKARGTEVSSLCIAIVVVVFWSWAHPPVMMYSKQTPRASSGVRFIRSERRKRGAPCKVR